MQTVVRFRLAATLAAALVVLPLAAQTSTVVYVGGNDLVVKAADGKVLNYMVPAGTMFSAGGKQVALGGLMPGTAVMVPAGAGAPQVVATVQVVKAKVYGTTPPDGLTLTTPMGAKDFVVPMGSMFMVGGKSVGLTDLASDVTIDATLVTPAATDAGEVPPPATPAMVGTLLITKTDDLPSAGTNLPLYGVLGMTLLVAGLFLMRRKPVAV